MSVGNVAKTTQRRHPNPQEETVAGVDEGALLWCEGGGPIEKFVTRLRQVSCKQGMSPRKKRMGNLRVVRSRCRVIVARTTKNTVPTEERRQRKRTSSGKPSAARPQERRARSKREKRSTLDKTVTLNDCQGECDAWDSGAPGGCAQSN